MSKWKVDERSMRLKLVKDYGQVGSFRKKIFVFCNGNDVHDSQMDNPLFLTNLSI